MLGWPAGSVLSLPSSFVLSLTVVAGGLALTFAIGGSILVAVGFVLAVSLVSAAIGVKKPAHARLERLDRRALTGSLVGAIPVAAVTWWAAGPLFGDGLFHLARARKLAEFDALSALTTVDEFKDGGLHPGYAFPLWQGVDALIARLAGVDVTAVLLYLPAILVPLAFLLAYVAGKTVFGSWSGGVALVVIQAALVGFSRRDHFFEGTGLFETLSQPQAASRLLLAPALLALAVAFAVNGDRVLLVSVAAAGFALAVVHPTYAPYVALVFGGFLVARAVLIRGWEPLLTRGTVALGALLVPFGLLLVLLLPIVEGTQGLGRSADRAARLGHNNGFTVLGDWFGYSPSAIAREGPVVVAGLLAIPFAAFAARRLWAAFVLGGSLAVLVVLLTPPLFTALSDVVSVSQSRRLASFIPLGFAVAGACILLSRFRMLAGGFAFAAGLVLVIVYPGEFTRTVEAAAPAWAVVFAVVGGFVALAAGALLRGGGPTPTAWAVAIALAFTAPVAVAGLNAVQSGETVGGLTPAVIAALREHVGPGEVVFSDPETAYEAAAYAPVYINAAPRGNVADTKRNRPRARLQDARRFFHGPMTNASRAAMLDRYGADWLVVGPTETLPTSFLGTLPRVFSEDGFALYRVPG